MVGFTLDERYTIKGHRLLWLVVKACNGYQPQTSSLIDFFKEIAREASTHAVEHNLEKSKELKDD